MKDYSLEYKLLHPLIPVDEVAQLNIIGSIAYLTEIMPEEQVKPKFVLIIT